MTHENRRKKRIMFAHKVRETLRAAGLHQLIRHHEGFFITPTATLRPRWGISRHGVRHLHLQVSGRLAPHHLGALHLRGLLGKE